MMSEKLLKAFEECEKFIEEHTPEELAKYEESLNLDYERYSDGITFSDYIDLGIISNSVHGEMTYKNRDCSTEISSCKISKLIFATAA